MGDAPHRTVVMKYMPQPSDVLDRVEAEVRAEVDGKLDANYIQGWIDAARAAGWTLLLRELRKRVREPVKPLSEADLAQSRAIMRDYLGMHRMED